MNAIHIQAGGGDYDGRNVGAGANWVRLVLRWGAVPLVRLGEVMLVIRPAEAGDLEAVEAIQSASPEAARWPAAEYLAHRFTVAICDGAVAAFLVWRPVAEDECEVLNLAVAPPFRRQGLARELLKPLLSLRNARIYLEVRESNRGARMFYNSMGFQEVSIRKKYYNFPLESAIVMKFHSC